LTPIRLFPLGACQLGAPLAPLAVSNRVWLSSVQIGLGSISCYTMAECLQRIRFCRGEFDVPDRFRFYCNLPRAFDPVAQNARRVEDVDLVLLEPNSPIGTFFDAYALNRSTLLTGFINALAQLGSETSKATSAWFQRGLLGCNDESLREAAQALLPLIDDRFDDPATIRDLLLGARGRPQDLKAYVDSIAELRDMVGRPIGLVAYIHQYLPDGRPLPWPPDHLENTIQAAQRLGIPLFNPMVVVQEHGVASAMDEQRKLYRNEFCPVIGEALFDFCQAIVDEAQSGAREVPAKDLAIAAQA